jgi:hypothetical protein
VDFSFGGWEFGESVRDFGNEPGNRRGYLVSLGCSVRVMKRFAAWGVGNHGQWETTANQLTLNSAVLIGN